MCRIFRRKPSTRIDDQSPHRSDWWFSALSLTVGLIGLAAIIISGVVQISYYNNQKELKRYEVTYIEKEKTYASLLNNFSDFFFDSTVSNTNDMLEASTNMKLSFYSIEPFLTKETRTAAWLLISDYGNWCITEVGNNYLAASESERLEMVGKYVAKMEALRGIIFPVLFPEANK